MKIGWQDIRAINPYSCIHSRMYLIVKIFFVFILTKDARDIVEVTCQHERFVFNIHRLMPHAAPFFAFDLLEFPFNWSRCVVRLILFMVHAWACSYQTRKRTAFNLIILSTRMNAYHCVDCVRSVPVNNFHNLKASVEIPRQTILVHLRHFKKAY